jgi:hypothetical protein
MKTRLAALVSVIFFAIATCAADAQTRMPAPAPQPVKLAVNAATLAGLPRVTVNATDEAGHANAYSGVSLHDLLVRAGAPDGKAVRGAALASFVLAGAGDGYRVVFS